MRSQQLLVCVRAGRDATLKTSMRSFRIAILDAFPVIEGIHGNTRHFLTLVVRLHDGVEVADKGTRSQFWPRRDATASIGKELELQPLTVQYYLFLTQESIYFDLRP